jgi:tripartite-type tricarboxylate transporter receptor subunit TctC
MNRMKWMAVLRALAATSAGLFVFFASFHLPDWYSIRPALAQAQSWPTRPIKFVVPFPPGGGNDILGRIVGEGLTQALGVPIVVENRPGAGGNIGADYVAKSAADGYTYLVTPISILNFNPYLFSNLSFDPIKDFDAVALFGVSPVVLAVNSELPVKSVAELIELAKAKPDSLSYASSGIGTPHHLAGEMFKSMAGVSILHVPYKGGAPAAIDLIAGRVQIMFAPINDIKPFLKNGKVRILGVGSEKRIPSLPSVPTIAEAGLPNFNIEVWYGLVAPAGVPKEIISKLNNEIAKVLAQPTIREKIEVEGMEPAIVTPEQLTALIRTGYIRWGTVIKNAHIKLSN